MSLGSTTHQKSRQLELTGARLGEAESGERSGEVHPAAHGDERSGSGDLLDWGARRQALGRVAQMRLERGARCAHRLTILLQLAPALVSVARFPCCCAQAPCSLCQHCDIFRHEGARSYAVAVPLSVHATAIDLALPPTAAGWVAIRRYPTRPDRTFCAIHLRRKDVVVVVHGVDGHAVIVACRPTSDQPGQRFMTTPFVAARRRYAPRRQFRLGRRDRAS